MILDLLSETRFHLLLAFLRFVDNEEGQRREARYN
jgi:hypothetical protein